MNTKITVKKSLGKYMECLGTPCWSISFHCYPNFRNQYSRLTTGSPT